jgi:hypothetical protein
MLSPRQATRLRLGLMLLLARVWEKTNVKLKAATRIAVTKNAATRIVRIRRLRFFSDVFFHVLASLVLVDVLD